MIKIDNKEQCCGCEACKQVCPKHCISMSYDDEGFIYPIVNNETCIQCGRCIKVCPIKNDNIYRDPIKVLAAQNTNDSIRKISSSGGMFYLLAEYIIKNGGVVFGAKFDSNWHVVHDYTETIEGLNAFIGSKYVQSNIGNCFNDVKRFLQSERYVLFSGTPCQVRALSLFLNKKYEKLLLVDIICHGVPSPLLWDRYLKEESKSNNGYSTIEYVSFRHKVKEWEKFHLCIKGNNIEKSEFFNDSVFGKAFVHNLFLRPSCYSCPIKHLSSGSDFTLGDFWGIDNFYPKFNDHKGTSLFIVNSSKGDNVLSNISFKSICSSYEIGLKWNKVLNIPMPYNKKRERFYKHYRKHGNIKEAILKYTKEPFTHVIKKKIKHTIKAVFKR